MKRTLIPYALAALLTSTAGAQTEVERTVPARWWSPAGTSPG